MRKLIFTQAAILTSIMMLTGCSNLPGSSEQQGAVIGGASGAVAGAAIGGEDNRVLGALIGGVLGAGGGYLIGANKDKILNRDTDSARRASRRAQNSPATVQQARNANDADINNDGFVTLDEVVAMRRAGFSDSQMLARLERTGQVFDLTSEQEEYLGENGVSREVIRDMQALNMGAAEDPVLNPPPVDSTIGREPVIP